MSAAERWVTYTVWVVNLHFGDVVLGAGGAWGVEQGARDFAEGAEASGFCKATVRQQEQCILTAYGAPTAATDPYLCLPLTKKELRARREADRQKRRDSGRLEAETYVEYIAECGRAGVKPGSALPMGVSS